MNTSRTRYYFTDERSDCCSEGKSGPRHTTNSEIQLSLQRTWGHSLSRRIQRECRCRRRTADKGRSSSLRIKNLVCHVPSPRATDFNGFPVLPGHCTLKMANTWICLPDSDAVQRLGKRIVSIFRAVIVSTKKSQKQCTAGALLFREQTGICSHLEQWTLKGLSFHRNKADA